ncbi:MAG: class I adenylate-forming enzyme family protein [Oceanidesulfovibrio sp.]
MNLCTIYAEALRATPDAPYLVVDDDVLSYAQLHRNVWDDARALHRLGVQQGDRVAFHMDNRLDIASLYFACFRIGAVATPISCFDSPTEAAFSINNCAAHVLIIEAELAHKLQKIRDNAPELSQCFIVGECQENSAPSWEEQRALPSEEPPVADVAEDHPAAILYTSGSTGKPKGVTHTHGSLLHNAENRIAAFGHQSGDSFLILSKLCHGAGLSSQLVTLAKCGGFTLCTRGHSVAETHALMKRWKPTLVGTSPSFLREMLHDPTFDPADYAALKALYVGGDKAPLDLYELLPSKTGLELREALGMTECGGYLNCRPSMRPKPGSAGMPIPGTEIRIVDADGNEMPQGKEGELVLRTKALMSGYWNEPEITARTIRNGWMHTGDLALVDEDGYFFITGRIKDTIIRDTGNITPAEVEEVMITHPAVAQCGVFGIPDGDRGEAVVAAIVPADPKTPPDTASLNEFALSNLAERKVPSHWLLLDTMPVTDGMGKIDRKALKAIAHCNMKNLKSAPA